MHASMGQGEIGALSWLRCIRRCLAVTCLALMLAGCGARIIKPGGVPGDAVQILLLDHGQHASLVLPTSTHGMVRYSYGDWAYYAEGRTGWVDALRALFVPSRAALGRRQLSGTPTPESIDAFVLVPIAQVYPFIVEAAHVESLRTALDDLFSARLDTLIYRPEVDLEFVEHPVPYSLRHNSNRMVAEWLRALGLDVEGTPLLSRWQVLEAQAHGPHGRGTGP